MTGVFAALGVGVSVAIIAAGGGFSGGGAPIFNPPTAADIWRVGSSIQDGTEFEYSLTARDETSSLEDAQVSMAFAESGSNWDVTFIVTNGTGQPIENTMAMSKELTREGQLDESFRPYFAPIQSSLFAVRDMEYGESPKYLVVGAPWNQIFYKSSEVIVRVTGEETVQTQAGTFDTFVLSFKLEENTSRIWVVKEMPLPIKAEVYDSEDQLQYQYELVRASGI
jgi:hypothetical protein